MSSQAKYQYHFPQSHIRDLCWRIRKKGFYSVPTNFLFSRYQDLQTCYNGIGPSYWSDKCLGMITFALSFLEEAALIHDWEYVYQPKKYSVFTKANLRLIWNATRSGHPFSGIASAVLCQLFGWRAFCKIENGKYLKYNLISGRKPKAKKD